MASLLIDGTVTEAILNLIVDGRHGANNGGTGVKMNSLINHPISESSQFFPVGCVRRGEFIQPWGESYHEASLGSLVQSIHYMVGGPRGATLVVRTRENNYLVIRPPSLFDEKRRGYYFTNYRVFQDRDQAIMCALMEQTNEQTT